MSHTRVGSGWWNGGAAGLQGLVHIILVVGLVLSPLSDEDAPESPERSRALAVAVVAAGPTEWLVAAARYEPC